MQKPFLVRHPNARSPSLRKHLRTSQASEVRVSKVERTRVVSRDSAFRYVQGTGRYLANVLRIRTIDGHVRPDFRYNIECHIPRTADGVKSTIRRLRPQEAEELTAIDLEAARLIEQLQELYKKRADVLDRAWQRGHVVHLKELDDAVIQGNTWGVLTDNGARPGTREEDDDALG